MTKKSAILIVIVAVIAVATLLLQSGSKAVFQAEIAINSLLSCSLEDAEKFDAALAPKLPADEPGIQSAGDALTVYLTERYGESMTDDCIEKLAANRTFYRSVKLAKDQNCDIVMSELKLSAESGNKNTFDFSAVLLANGKEVETVSGSVRMVNTNEWKADLITIN